MQKTLNIEHITRNNMHDLIRQRSTPLPFLLCDNYGTMRNGTITTRADVYAEEIPCTSESVIMSSDSPPPLQTSVPLVDYDIPDEACSGKITPTTPTTPVTNKLLNTDAETIENAVPITQAVLPVPEPQPKIERNGFDSETTKPIAQSENDSCVVDCIYFTQQCCECVIL